MAIGPPDGRPVCHLSVLFLTLILPVKLRLDLFIDNGVHNRDQHKIFLLDRHYCNIAFLSALREVHQP